MLIYQTRREVQPNGNIHYLDWLEEAEPPAELQEGAAKLRRAITEPEPAQYGMLEIKKYSEDQARDESGKWTSDGGAAQNYPRAGKTVDGLQVMDEVPNRESIAASLDDYEILPGIREVPMAHFKTGLSDLFYAHDDYEHARDLANRISTSGRIAPLIVVVDKEGPYVLEGGHRLGALGLLDKKSFPALVVIDKTDYSGDKVCKVHASFGKRSETSTIHANLVKAKPHRKEPPVIHPGRMAPPSILGKHKLERDLTKIFRTMHRKTTKVVAAALGLPHAHLAKAGPDADMTLRQAMDSLAAEWETVARLAKKPLTDAALAGASKGGLELEITAEDMLTGINETARDWASNRAAELVGMRRTPEGEFIVNPSAKWAISDVTRDKLRSVISDVFSQEGKIALRDVENRIEQSGIFSDVRASTIARTEISRAQTQGNREAWKQSGIVEQVTWLLSADHDKDDVCDELADGSPYDINDVPDLPAHPNCLCALVLIEPGDAEADKLMKYSEDQPRDDAGKWTDTGGGKETFHGTSIERGKKILKEGLLPQTGKYQVVYSSPSRDDAFVHAAQTNYKDSLGDSSFDNSGFAIVVIKDAESAPGFTRIPTSAGAASEWHVNAKVPPEFIDRVEIYRFKDFSSGAKPAPFRILKVSEAANKSPEFIYSVVFFKEE